MASLLDARIIVTTAANVRINGGKLRIYEEGTVTLASVFSDPDLVTPLTNPVVANSAGVLPQIFGVEGETVDCTMLDASNVEVSGRSFQMSFLGSETGAILRDFTDSRFTVRDDAGVVQIEVGDPVGDNVGGTGRLGGWNGTQGDAMEFDFAAVDVSGELTTAGGKKLPSVVQTEATTFTSVASVDIPLPNTPAGTIGWRITITRLLMEGSGGNLIARFSYDGGATYKSGANDYAWGLVYRDAAGSAANPGDDLDTNMRLGVMGGSTTLWGTMILDIDTVESGSGPTIITGQGALFDTDATPAIAPFSIAAAGMGDYGRATHLRILGTADISGRYTVETKRGLGA